MSGSGCGPVVGFCGQRESVNPGRTNPGQQNFLQRYLVLVERRCAICCMPPMGRPEFSGGFYIFGQFMHCWHYSILSIVARNTYFYGEVKPGFPVCGYEFSECVNKSNEAS